MITNVWNDGVVFYQIVADEESMANEAILIHRDNNGSLIIAQQDRSIVLDLHRGNLKEFAKAIDGVLAKSEEAARRAPKK